MVDVSVKRVQGLKVQPRVKSESARYIKEIRVMQLAGNAVLSQAFSDTMYNIKPCKGDFEVPGYLVLGRTSDVEFWVPTTACVSVAYGYK